MKVKKWTSFSCIGFSICTYCHWEKGFGVFIFTFHIYWHILSVELLTSLWFVASSLCISFFLLRFSWVIIWLFDIPHISRDVVHKKTYKCVRPSSQSASSSSGCQTRTTRRSRTAPTSPIRRYLLFHTPILLPSFLSVFLFFFRFI